AVGVLAFGALAFCAWANVGATPPVNATSNRNIRIVPCIALLHLFFHLAKKTMGGASPDAPLTVSLQQLSHHNYQ
ncbi:MAG: hypothetical protein OEY27_04075, partial [Gammaproteobacteria bacterium]|nr:hypothetical protein [Gammaproteobacteria bacterium]